MIHPCDGQTDGWAISYSALNIHVCLLYAVAHRKKTAISSSSVVNSRMLAACAFASVCEINIFIIGYYGHKTLNSQLTNGRSLVTLTTRRTHTYRSRSVLFRPIYID